MNSNDKLADVGKQAIEDALSKALKGKFGDAPIALDPKEAVNWFQASASAYQHALEMWSVTYPPVEGEWVMVPRVSTIEMELAGAEALEEGVSMNVQAERCYAAMLASAPTPPAGKQDVYRWQVAGSDEWHQGVDWPNGARNLTVVSVAPAPSAPAPDHIADAGEMVAADARDVIGWREVDGVRVFTVESSITGHRREFVALEDYQAKPAPAVGGEGIASFEDYFKADSEDPSMERELEIWLAAWRAAHPPAPQGDVAVTDASVDAVQSKLADHGYVIPIRVISAALNAITAQTAQEPTHD